MKLISKLLLIFISLFIPEISNGQNTFLKLDELPPVTINGTLLKYPWAGGLNSPLFNEIELNGDAHMDLILFDRVSNRYFPFLNDGLSGQAAYHFESKYIDKFPPLHDWIRTFDYDCDGDLDLFTYTNQAVGVYRNDYTSSAGLSFTSVTDTLYSDFGTLTNPISGNSANVPAFVDMDNDGDIDILTFSNSSSYVEYHRNMSFDSLGICGGFKFYFQPYCWGKFKLSGLANIAFLNDACRSNIVSPLDAQNRSRHAGSVLIALDQDCDSDFDLLNGDILGENLLYLYNGGVPDTATIISQDSLFPSYDVGVNLRSLPAPAYLDVDNDGMKDLIVTPSANTGEDFNNILYYSNTTDNCSNVFSFTTNRLLINDMIDVGTAANVTWFDVDGDGLLDIISGNDKYFNVNPALEAARLAYFKNTGSATQPEFTLITDDWLGLASINQLSLAPAFGDLDNDGDKDLLMGSSGGSLIYYQNNNGTFTFTSPQLQGISAGNNAVPQLVDVDRDGKIDLLVGNRSGKIRYYQNTGTSSNPIFTNSSNFFGGVNVLKSGAAAGYAAPILFDNAGAYELLVGSESGYIYHYGNIDGNLAGNFTLIDSTYQSIYEPKKVSIAMGDIDSDGKFDLLTGCQTGGFRLYTQSASLSLAETSSTNNHSWMLSPNPASNNVTIKAMQPLLNDLRHYQIVDITGKVISSSNFKGGYFEVDITHLQSGFYVFQIVSSNKVESIKFIKQ